MTNQNAAPQGTNTRFPTKPKAPRGKAASGRLVAQKSVTATSFYRNLANAGILYVSK